MSNFVSGGGRCFLFSRCLFCERLGLPQSAASSRRRRGRDQLASRTRRMSPIRRPAGRRRHATSTGRRRLPSTATRARRHTRVPVCVCARMCRTQSGGGGQVPPVPLLYTTNHALGPSARQACVACGACRVMAGYTPGTRRALAGYSPGTGTVLALCTRPAATTRSNMARVRVLGPSTGARHDGRGCRVGDHDASGAVRKATSRATDPPRPGPYWKLVLDERGRHNSAGAAVQVRDLPSQAAETHCNLSHNLSRRDGSPACVGGGRGQGVVATSEGLGRRHGGKAP